MIDFDKIDRSVPILESKGLCKYFGGLKAVENVDMKVMAGDIFGIIGPNGAGKSTLIDLATGLTKPKSGNIKVFGFDPLRAVRSGRIGVSQQSGTFPEILTIKSALQLLAAAWPKHLPIEQLMELCDLNKIA